MNGYFDYDETEYDFTPLDAGVKPAPPKCDRCRFLPGEAVAVGPLFAVCACWIGQGSPRGGVRVRSRRWGGGRWPRPRLMQRFRRKDSAR